MACWCSCTQCRRVDRSMREWCEDTTTSAQPQSVDNLDKGAIEGIEAPIGAAAEVRVPYSHATKRERGRATRAPQPIHTQKRHHNMCLYAPQPQPSSPTLSLRGPTCHGSTSRTARQRSVREGPTKEGPTNARSTTYTTRGEAQAQHMPAHTCSASTGSFSSGCGTQRPRVRNTRGTGRGNTTIQENAGKNTTIHGTARERGARGCRNNTV